eukprot:361935-Chlamydomonas_euryale.AAC.6
MPQPPHIDYALTMDEEDDERFFMSEGAQELCVCVCTDMCGAAGQCLRAFYKRNKDEIMVVGRRVTLPLFKLSGKELLVTDSLTYLRSFFVDDGSMSRDMDVRNVHALAAFCQF